MKLVKYGIKHPKHGLLGCDNIQNDINSIDLHHKSIWITDNKEDAEYVLSGKTSWYNADYELPFNPYYEHDLEVVKITLEF